MTFSIKQSKFTPEIKKHISDGLKKHAIKTMGIDGTSLEPVAFEITHEENLAGYAVVQLFWGQLYIKYLYVEEEFRGFGLAKKLMEEIFHYGKTQGCTFAFVETMNFQAPDFYQKLGFKIEFISSGYNKDVSFYYLSKQLV